LFEVVAAQHLVVPQRLLLQEMAVVMAGQEGALVLVQVVMLETVEPVVVTLVTLDQEAVVVLEAASCKIQQNFLLAVVVV